MSDWLPNGGATNRGVSLWPARDMAVSIAIRRTTRDVVREVVAARDGDMTIFNQRCPECGRWDSVEITDLKLLFAPSCAFIARALDERYRLHRESGLCGATP